MKPEYWLDDYNFDIADRMTSWTCWIEYHYGNLLFNSSEPTDSANGRCFKQVVKEGKVYYDYL